MGAPQGQNCSAGCVPNSTSNTRQRRLRAFRETWEFRTLEKRGRVRVSRYCFGNRGNNRRKNARAAESLCRLLERDERHRNLSTGPPRETQITQASTYRRSLSLHVHSRFTSVCRL